MHNQSLLFDRILHGDLRPWLEWNKFDEKFAMLTADVKKISPNFQPLYEIEFYHCFNQKTKYYHKLIINEVTDYCNRIIELIRGEDDIRVLNYLLSDTLMKKLRTLLKDVGKLIRVNDYDLNYIDPCKSDPDICAEHKSETYIMQLLKTALTYFYLEIQEVFKTYIPEQEYMELEDLYLQALSEQIPEQTFLKRRVQIVVTEGYFKNNVISPQPREDVNLLSFTYKQFIKKGENLLDLRDRLIDYRFIDTNTSFKEFKRVFSGKKVLNPVRWTGNDSEFYYFIYLICAKYKLVKDLQQYQWEVACRCFVKADGTPFDHNRIKNLNKPQKTAGLIEDAVRLLMC